MGVKSMFVCDGCNQIIPPKRGKIFKGNVYMCTENVEERGGLIGNAFPNTSEDGTIIVDEIKEYVLCDSCIRETLML